MPSEINEEVDDIKIVQFPAEQEDEDDDDEAEDLDAYTQSGMLDDVSRWSCFVVSNIYKN